MMGMKYCIRTKYFGPTNTKGARIKAFCLWGSVVVSYDYAARDPHWEAVKALLAKLSGPAAAAVTAEELVAPEGGTLYVVELGARDLSDPYIGSAVAEDDRLARAVAGREAA